MILQEQKQLKVYSVGTSAMNDYGRNTTQQDMVQ